MMQIGEPFASRLRQIREARDMTQRQLAEAAKLSQKTVSALEQGVSQPAWLTVVALADALQVDIRAFLPQSRRELPTKRGRGRPRKRVEPTKGKPGDVVTVQVFDPPRKELGIVNYRISDAPHKERTS
jgi:transcriptional regulator with XRE-family HTH domain